MLRRFCSSWCSAADARALLAVAVIAALTLPGVTRRIYASDEVQYVAFLRSLWFDRDVSFDNEYRQFYANGTTRDPMFAATFIEPATETGLRRNFGTIGSALLWAPFYAAADAGVRAARAMGSTVAADGYSAPYISAVCIGSAVYGLLALLLAWRAARRVLEAAGLPAGPHAVAASAAAGLGTPLLFYMYVAPGFAHATSAFAVAAFVLAWLVVRERWSPAGMVVLGALAGLMAMVREQDAFVIVGPAIDLAWAVVRDRRVRPVGPALAGAAAAVLVYLPQAAAYLALNGRARAVAARQPQDDVVVASRGGGAVLARARALLLDAAGPGRRRRPRAAGRARGRHAHAFRRRLAHPRGVAEDWRRPAGHRDRPGLRRRLGGELDGGRRLRAAPLRGDDLAVRDRPRGARGASAPARGRGRPPRCSRACACGGTSD